MRLCYATIFLGFASALLSGCAQEKSEDLSIFDQYLSLESDLVANQCSCIWDGDDSAERECRADRAIPSEEVECLQEVWIQYPDEVDAYLHCIIDSWQPYIECQRAANCDNAELNACSNQYADVLFDCTDLEGPALWAWTDCPS